MKRYSFKLCVLIIFCFFFGCMSPRYVVSEFGDEAILSFNNKDKLECEIVFFTDTSIVISPRLDNQFEYRSQLKNLYYINYSELRSITIEGFDGSGWRTSVLLGQVLPAALLAIAASSADVDPFSVFAVCSIPAVISTILFLGSEGETPQWNSSENRDKTNNLNIYSRYPDGLSNDEVLKLLDHIRQKEIKKYNLGQ